MIQDLTDYMVEKGRNIEPLPKVEFVDSDIENAKDFFWVKQLIMILIPKL